MIARVSAPVGAILLLALTAGLSGPAAASEERDIERAQAIAALHRGEPEQARDMLDELLRRSGNDVVARYYRAVALLQLDEPASAVADLRIVVAARPDDPRVALELGVALLAAGSTDEADEWLRRAMRDPTLRAAASYRLGFVAYRRGDLDAALASFAAVPDDDPIGPRARYYEGLIQYQLGDWPEARRKLAAVRSGKPDAQLDAEAARLLAQLGGGDAPRLRMRGLFGFDYDSNVVLAPTDASVPSDLLVTDQRDGRATLLGEAQLTLLQHEAIQLTAGYQFYQTLYFDLTQYNLQDHGPSISFVVGDRVQGGVTVRYDYQLLETSSFLQQLAGGPWLRVPEGEFGEAQLFYRVRWQDYYQADFRPLDAVRQQLGVRQSIYLDGPGRELWLGYQYLTNDATRATGNAFAYVANLVEAGVTWAFPELGAVALLGYSYCGFGYAPASRGRADSQSAVNAEVRKRLDEHFAVRVGYFGTFNDSNQAPFEYQRNVASVALEAAF